MNARTPFDQMLARRKSILQSESNCKQIILTRIIFLFCWTDETTLKFIS